VGVGLFVVTAVNKFVPSSFGSCTGDRGGVIAVVGEGKDVVE
jgi:hypothetical protein